MKARIAVSLALAVGFAGSESVRAQSLWGTDIPGSIAVNFTAPMVCPAGPIVGGFPYFPPLPWPCPTVGPIPLAAAVPGLGDITYDRVTNSVWVTDGIVITNFTRLGAIIRSFPAPPALGPITGLGWGTLGGVSVLIVTDGFMAAAIVPPPAPGCAFAAFFVPPFPLPLPLATDIDFDPVTGTLFYTSAAGFVVNAMIGGGLGPFGVTPAGVPACPLAMPSGIAVDVSACGTLFVTDGALVQRRTFLGGAAPPSPYALASCFPIPFPGVGTGLGFDAAAVDYGMGCDPVLPDPVLAGIGQARTPGPGFGTLLTTSVPGSAGLILVALGAACPPVIASGCPIYAFPIAFTIGPYFVPVGGSIGVPLPIPPGLPCGITVSMQWYLVKPGGGVATSNPIEFTIAQP